MIEKLNKNELGNVDNTFMLILQKKVWSILYTFWRVSVWSMYVFGAKQIVQKDYGFTLQCEISRA